MASISSSIRAIFLSCVASILLTVDNTLAIPLRVITTFLSLVYILLAIIAREEPPWKSSDEHKMTRLLVQHVSDDPINRIPSAEHRTHSEVHLIAYLLDTVSPKDVRQGLRRKVS
jgi:hypothetical protein